jgi:hypothetical protein
MPAGIPAALRRYGARPGLDSQESHSVRWIMCDSPAAQTRSLAGAWRSGHRPRRGLLLRRPRKPAPEPGPNDNTNRLIRDVLPKSRNLTEVTPSSLQRIVRQITTRPRECLNHLTSQEAALTTPPRSHGDIGVAEEGSTDEAEPTQSISGDNDTFSEPFINTEGYGTASYASRTNTR